MVANMNVAGRACTLGLLIFMMVEPAVSKATGRRSPSQRKLTPHSASDVALHAGPSSPNQAPVDDKPKEDHSGQRIRICNAFTWPGAVDVFLTRTGQQVTQMDYKHCKDYKLPLQVGDELLFKAKSLQIGTFAVTALPADNVLLLLVVQRRKSGAGATFQSHAFAPQENGSDKKGVQMSGQLALVDTYKGKVNTDKVYLKDLTASGKSDSKTVNLLAAAVEEVPLNSVVSLDRGRYEFSLDKNVWPGSSVSTAARTCTSVEVQPGEEMVLMRVGDDENQPNQEQRYPLEFFMYPAPPSASHRPALLLAVLVAAAAAIML
eukprot:gnl/TRDRNA2_/TRDRNA2_187297_c0_seq1.p1 gnl/TRDRNA2_/TRDRNA2_187297_c0~~gnl/TRDRNA2_/TRDRNA2_187297_c0_seq1.p1  ORF type:complete len:319 (+),score=71.29 gnl/TRDRNA2_/TRDRNA2_187297_c0_seq1:43-999(+)